MTEQSVSPRGESSRKSFFSSFFNFNQNSLYVLGIATLIFVFLIVLLFLKQQSKGPVSKTKPSQQSASLLYPPIPTTFHCPTTSSYCNTARPFGNGIGGI